MAEGWGDSVVTDILTEIGLEETLILLKSRESFIRKLLLSCLGLCFVVLHGIE